MLASSTRSKVASHRSGLASWLQSKARNLSYNDENASLKHKLHEASHALDAASVCVIEKRGLPFIRNARGKQRRMLIREYMAWRLLGRRLEIQP